jgi:hypothetical protein
MSHDPFAQIDQTLLDMIEHSSTGVVPHTPAYQDGLRRLRATHQVYLSADHAGGFVTARSLATRAAFYPENLEQVMKGEADEAALEQDAAVFDRYVASLPEARRAAAETARALVVAKKAHHRARHGAEAVRDPLHSLFLVPGTGPHPGLAGDYLHCWVHETPTGAWAVALHDGMDGEAKREVATRGEAWAAVEELVASAPFDLSELAALGYQSNYGK